MLPRFICLLLLWGSSCFGFKSFQQRIPNGDMVPHSCKPNFLWHGLGHENELGGGARNSFGMDFAAAGLKWTKELCEKDSDGDGRTNGQELGDPNCTWKENSTPETNQGLSHPGVCEPHDSDLCKPKNTWLNCELESFKCDAIKSPEVKNVTIRFPNTSVPNFETNYFCMTFDLPTDGDYHVIAMTPVIENKNVMHHILLFGCDSDKQGEASGPTACEMGSVHCNTLFGAWTVGSAGQCLYHEAGIRIGQKGIKRVLMQVHWNNPEMRDDYSDSSGMTLHYTPKLRPNSAVMLMVGQWYLEIPPGRERHAESAVCSKEDTHRLLTGPIKIVRALNHMHYLGREESLEIIRNEKRIAYVTNETTYSYDRPKFVTISPPLEIQPGDEIKTTCVFKSKNKKKTTFSGRGTSDEMCLGFMVVFPAENLLSRTCTTWRSLSLTKLYRDLNPYGCNITNFFNLSHPDTRPLLEKLENNCKPFSICLEECKEVVKEVRKHPCLSGDVGKYIVHRAAQMFNGDFPRFLSLLQSCDVEMLKDKQVQRLTNNNESSGSVSPRRHLELIVSFLCVTLILLI